MKRNLLFSALIITIWGFSLTSCNVINGLGATPEPTPLPTITAIPGVMAEGRVVPRSYTALTHTGSPATITEIAISEGDQVEKDALLISLADRESLQAALDAALVVKIQGQQQLDTLERNTKIDQAVAAQELAAANLAVTQAQLALDDFTSQKFKDELDDQRDTIQDAKVELADRQAKLDDYADLDADNVTRKNAQQRVDEAARKLHAAELKRDQMISQHDQAQAAYDLALARQSEAQRKVNASENGPDKEELALAQANLQSAESQIATAQAMLDNMDLRAPYAGTIMAIHNVENGEVVNPGQVLITMADTNQWFVETTDLTELDVAQLRVGQHVTLVPDAFPKQTLAGTLESISRTFVERSGDVLYTARVLISEPFDDLRWGMTVEVTFPE